MWLILGRSIQAATAAILQVVTAVLGLIGLVIFSACVIALAAGVTWLVVKLIPAGRGERSQQAG